MAENLITKCRTALVMRGQLMGVGSGHFLSGQTGLQLIFAGGLLPGEIKSCRARAYLKSVW